MPITPFITESTTCQGGTACGNQFTQNGINQNNFVNSTQGGSRRRLRGGTMATPPGTVIVTPLPSSPISGTNLSNNNTSMQSASNQGVENAKGGPNSTGDQCIGTAPCSVTKGGRRRVKKSRRRKSRKSRKGRKGKKTRKFNRRNI